MFQDFSGSPPASLGVERIKRLRALMGDLGVGAVLVPRADEHQGEYVAASSERLRWLTGFTGSAGNAVVGARKAALFVDGRYTLQARAQCDAAIEIVKAGLDPMVDWMLKALPAGTIVSFDPWLHTIAFIDQLSAKLTPRGLTLRPLRRNPIDQVWGKDRPTAPVGPVIVQPLELSGRSSVDKLADIKKALKDAGEDSAILTKPDSVAWLFNIRGSDIPHTPTPLAFAIVHAADKAELFIDGRKLDKSLRSHLTSVARLREPDELAARIDHLKAEKKRVRLHAASAAWWLKRRLGGAKANVVDAPDPCQLPKAIKNEAEIVGMRAAQVRDGAAMVRFLAWLDREAPGGRVDEIGAVKALEQFRAETQALKEISFDTISGSGPNGAIVHYRVTEATNRKLRPGELFLVDSGGQYVDGTTDITRTIAIGKPMREMCERFTLVLRSHIAVATAVFPRGTRGIAIDAMARRPLWECGFNFDHGTGHGVGSYLSVHEGPQGISESATTQGIEPGMFISNEPGYYKEGAYGIRLENLVLSTQPAKIDGGEREMMTFETLTFCPFDRRLILKDNLSPAELGWLDGYHKQVMTVIGPHVRGQDHDWLKDATAPL